MKKQENKSTCLEKKELFNEIKSDKIVNKIVNKTLNNTESKIKSESSDEIDNSLDGASKKVEIKEVFRWKNKFPFEEDRISMLIIYDKTHESFSSLNSVVDSLKLLFPISSVSSVPSINSLLELLSIKKEINGKRRLETKLDGMIYKDSDKTNTTESTTIIDISSIKNDKSYVELYKKFQDYVYDNTHVLAMVSSDSVINNYYELFDVILFMNPCDSNNFLMKRYTKKVEKNNYINKGIIVDNREYYYTISFYNFVRIE